MFSIDESSTELTITFPDRMDTVACKELEDQILDRVAASAKPVVFDLAGVTYISSTFIRVCVKVAKKRAAHQFRLVRVEPEVRSIFTLCGLDQELTIV